MLKVVRNTTKTILKNTLMLIFLTAGSVFAQQEAPITDGNATKYLYGIAAVYNDSFEGEATASGEKYNTQQLTAAHRSLPFGTRIEIENLSNGKKVEAIINDRGPFEKNRLINLSKQGSEILEFLSEGTTFVKITVLELGTSLSSPMKEIQASIGKDIPQNFTQPEQTNTSIPEEENLEPVEEYDDTYNDLLTQNPLAKNDSAILGDQILNEKDLFADLDNELDYMDDSFDETPPLTNKESALKGQNITNDFSFANNNPAIDPIGFDKNAQDILINDPLSNITIGPEDEYVIDPPIPSNIFDTVPHNITDEEKALISNNNSEDPFADLFNDTTDPYSFQDEVNSNLGSPVFPEVPTNNNAYNINGQPNNTRSVPKDNYLTNIVTITNEITNSTAADNLNGRSDRGFNNATNNSNIYNDLNSNSFDNTPPMNNQTEKIVPQKLGDHYVIQLGAFSKQKNALELYEKLRSNGFNAYITDVKVKGKNLMRVRVGHFTTIEEAIQISQKIESQQGFENRVIKVEYNEK